MEATASLCLWPRLGEYGSIDEVLLNIKMRAQIKGIIAGAGRSRLELVEGDMVGQANNMFWLLMNELQNGSVDLGEVYGRWCGWYEGVVLKRLSFGLWQISQKQDIDWIFHVLIPCVVLKMSRSILSRNIYLAWGGISVDTKLRSWLCRKWMGFC